MFSRLICPFQGRHLLDFADKTYLNNFSLLPAPLHVTYRERDEDEDLEKAYKEVCVICSPAPCWKLAQCEFQMIVRSQGLDLSS